MIMTTKDMQQIVCRLTSALILLFAHRDAGKGHDTSVRTKIQTWTSWICSRYDIGLTLTICVISAKLLNCGRGEIGIINTLRTGDTDLRFYITTVQDGWRKSAFLTHACFPCTIHLIMQYIEPVSEWSCWWMFIETWPHSELTFRHCASSI